MYREKNPILVIESAGGMGKSVLGPLVADAFKAFGVSTHVFEQPVDFLDHNGRPVMFETNSGPKGFRDAFKAGHFLSGDTRNEKLINALGAVLDNRGYLYNGLIPNCQKLGAGPEVKPGDVLLMIRDSLSSYVYEELWPGGGLGFPLSWAALAWGLWSRNIPPADSSMVILPDNMESYFGRIKTKDTSQDVFDAASLQQKYLNAYIDMAANPRIVKRMGISDSIFSVPSAKLEGDVAAETETAVLMWAISQYLVALPEKSPQFENVMRLNPDSTKTAGSAKIRINELIEVIEGGGVPSYLNWLRTPDIKTGELPSIELAYGYLYQSPGRRGHRLVGILDQLHKMVSQPSTVSSRWGDMAFILAPEYEDNQLVWEQGTYAKRVRLNARSQKT